MVYSLVYRWLSCWFNMVMWYLIYKYLHSNTRKHIFIMPFKYLFCVLIICEISCWAIMTLSIDCTVNITAKRIFLSNAQFKSKSHKNSCNWNIDSVSNQLLCTGNLGNHLKRNQRRHTNRFQQFYEEYWNLCSLIMCTMRHLYTLI